MPHVFWAVSAVTALIPKTPMVVKVFRSAWIPAPPPESEPAMVSARGIMMRALSQTPLRDARSGRTLRPHTKCAKSRHGDTMRIGIIGGGSFGTALAKLLAEFDHRVTLWFRDPAMARAVAASRENQVYLPGFQLPATVVLTHDLQQTVSGQELLVAVTPSHAMREVMTQARHYITGRPYVVSASKGIEEGSLQRMSQVLGEVLGPEFAGHIAALSGPSFAREVAAGMPTAVTAAAVNRDTAEVVQDAFRGPTFRVYSSTDVIGVELGGTVKNVIAIAAGVSDGLGLGNSSRAALITRGVAEIARLVAKTGGDPQTV